MIFKVFVPSKSKSVVTSTGSKTQYSNKYDEKSYEMGINYKQIPVYDGNLGMRL